MTKLPVLSGRKLIKILTKHGFKKVGQKGSHVRLKKKNKGDVRITTVPLHKEVSKFVLTTILRQTGLTRKQLLELR